MGGQKASNRHRPRAGFPRSRGGPLRVRGGDRGMDDSSYEVVDAPGSENACHPSPYEEKKRSSPRPFNRHSRERGNPGSKSVRKNNRFFTSPRRNMASFPSTRGGACVGFVVSFRYRGYGSLNCRDLSHPVPLKTTPLQTHYEPGFKF